jgi:uncharacterized protein YkwD
MVVLVLVVVPARVAHATHQRTHTATLRAGILADLNRIRQRHGLAPLSLSPELTAAARVHSDEMLARGYFSHSSFDGTVYWRRIKAFYPLVPGDTWAAGENLLWTHGTVVAGQAVAAWMGSPEHRHNILMPIWRQIGIAVRHDPDAPGVFRNRRVTVLTTDFGVR